MVRIVDSLVHVLQTPAAVLATVAATVTSRYRSKTYTLRVPEPLLARATVQVETLLRKCTSRFPKPLVQSAGGFRLLSCCALP